MGMDDDDRNNRPSQNIFYPNLKQTLLTAAPSSSEDSDSDTDSQTVPPLESTDAVHAHIEEEERSRQLFSDRQRDAVQMLHDTRSLVTLAVDNTDTLDDNIHFRYPPALNNSEESDNQLITLRVSVQGSGSRYGHNIVSRMDNDTLDSLLREGMTASLTRIDSLLKRVSDATSKVLVTGDVNAGKSTLINALLRQDILQTDQQPCTSAFFEISEPKEGEERDQVRAIPDPDSYDPMNVLTYTPYTHAHIKLTSATGNDSGKYRLWRVICKDDRPGSASLLSNGLVNVSFIDTPGLNRDISKTMSVFARQAEIDAVIFVVNAENHFTLSV